jgi:intracellular septation protein
VVLIGARLFSKKNIIKMMMGKEIQLPETIWSNLNIAWAIFFSALGALNLYVAFHYSIDIWASFKLFGTMGLMFIFIIAQSLVINKHIIQKENA